MNKKREFFSAWRMAAVKLPRQHKVLLQAAFDCFACALTAACVSLLLSSNAPHPEYSFVATTAISVGLFVPIAIRFGFYAMVVRFIGWRSGLKIGLAIATYFVFLLLVHFALPKFISFAYALLQPILLFVLVLGARAVLRYVLNIRSINYNTRGLGHQLKVLIYGAGSAGRQLANSLIIDGKTRVLGFIDDDVCLQGCDINGLIVHSSVQLAKLVQCAKVSELYLAIPSLSPQERHEKLAKLSELPVVVKTLPTLAEVINGTVHSSDLREVPIEEVLGRESISPDPSLLRENIYEKVVLITGAGGSIGSEIARQVLRQNPRRIILFEQNEYALYTIDASLDKLCSDEQRPKDFFPILGSVTDTRRLAQICEKFGVQTIYHAAACKHVPLVEKNPLMGIWNNVVGTKRLVEVAERFAVETFVLISTDKAVRPTNIMGCTKRIAELILQAEHQKACSANRTKFTMVRFGNVLGSSGSVIPAFKDQIKSGGPVKVTHPEIVRYFMTITEAAQLVIQAGALGSGGDVMVLDMGEPIKIRNLAEQMIRLSGLRVKTDIDPNGEIEILYTGLRPGEKLYEELLIGNNTSKTRHPRICLGSEQMIPWDLLAPKLRQLEESVVNNDSELARTIIKELVPEFVPQCDNQDCLILHDKTVFDSARALP